MNKPQAQAILLRYRPGTSDEGDPEVREALAFAAQNPELAAWLENQIQFQSAMRKSMREVAVPAGLKEQILSERRAVFNLRRMPRRDLLVGALAMAVILGVAAFMFWPARSHVDAQFTTYRAQMVGYALAGYTMEVESHDTLEIQKYLDQRQAGGAWPDSVSLRQQNLLGCATFGWSGQTAAMICYGPANKPDLWLFVVNSSAIADPPTESQFNTAHVSGLNTVSWSRGGKTYLLVADLPVSELRRIADGNG